MGKEDEIKILILREKESIEVIMKSEEHFEYMNSLESRNTSLKNEISETRTVMESTAVGLQNRKENKDNKDCAID